MTDSGESPNGPGYPENADCKQRMIWYVKTGCEEEAKALLGLVNQLESNFEWEITISPGEPP